MGLRFNFSDEVGKCGSYWLKVGSLLSFRTKIAFRSYPSYTCENAWFLGSTLLKQLKNNYILQIYLIIKKDICDLVFASFSINFFLQKTLGSIKKPKKKNKASSQITCIFFLTSVFDYFKLFYKTHFYMLKFVICERNLESLKIANLGPRR